MDFPSAGAGAGEVEVEGEVLGWIAGSIPMEGPVEVPVERASVGLAQRAWLFGFSLFASLIVLWVRKSVWAGGPFGCVERGQLTVG